MSAWDWLVVAVLAIAVAGFLYLVGSAWSHDRAGGDQHLGKIRVGKDLRG